MQAMQTAVCILVFSHLAQHTNYVIFLCIVQKMYSNSMQ